MTFQPVKGEGKSVQEHLIDFFSHKMGHVEKYVLFFPWTLSWENLVMFECDT